MEWLVAMAYGVLLYSYCRWSRMAVKTGGGDDEWDPLLNIEHRESFYNGFD